MINIESDGDYPIENVSEGLGLILTLNKSAGDFSAICIAGDGTRVTIAELNEGQNPIVCLYGKLVIQASGGANGIVAVTTLRGNFRLALSGASSGGGKFPDSIVYESEGSKSTLDDSGFEQQALSNGIATSKVVAKNGQLYVEGLSGLSKTSITSSSITVSSTSRDVETKCILSNEALVLPRDAKADSEAVPLSQVKALIADLESRVVLLNGNSVVTGTITFQDATINGKTLINGETTVNGILHLGDGITGQPANINGPVKVTATGDITTSNDPKTDQSLPNAGWVKAQIDAKFNDN